MKVVKLSNIQLGMLTIGFLYGSSAITNPAMIAKRDAWIALIISWIIGAGIILMVLCISKLNNGKSLNEILENCFGIILGRVIIILYIIFFIYKAAFNTFSFGIFMVTVTYPETPLVVIMGIFIVSTTYVVKCGLSTIGKISEVLAPLIPIPIFLVSISIVTMKNYTGFQPILLEIGPVVKSVASTISTVIGDFIAFLMILPYTNKQEGRSKAVFWGYFIIGLLLMVIVIRTLIVIGPVLLDSFVYPAHVAAQLIPTINIDPLVDVNLILGGGFKVTIFLYAVSKMISELFKIKNHRVFVSAFAILSIVVSLWFFPEATELRKWTGSWEIIMVNTPFQIILPVIMLIISIAKRYKTYNNSNKC